MAGYLSYEEYLERGGTLQEAAFADLERQARARIDALTYCRVRAMGEVPGAVKDAMMSAVGALGSCGAQALAEAAMLGSFTTDGYSESSQGAEARSGAANRALNREIEAMLAGVTDDFGAPLTYAGGVVS